jgi:uncharacterized protein YceK
MRLLLVSSVVLLLAGCSTLRSTSVERQAAPKGTVSLNKPYPKSYAEARTDRISVQYAVIELGKQVGLRYDWNASYRNTNPVCRRWVYPEIEDVDFDSAMQQILNPLQLSYVIEDGTITLVKAR